MFCDLFGQFFIFQNAGSGDDQQGLVPTALQIANLYRVFSHFITVP
jgi:hypothetical protein